MVVKELKLA